MNKLQNKTQIYIGLVVIMVLLISVGSFLWFGMVSEKAIEETFTEKANIQTQLLGSSISLHTNQIYSDLNMLAELPEVKKIGNNAGDKKAPDNLLVDKGLKMKGEEQQLYNYFQLYASEHLGTKAVYLGTAVGTYLVWPEIPLGPNFDPRMRAWYLNGLKGHGKVVQTDPYVDALTKRYVISNIRTFSDFSGQIKGVIGIDTTMSHLAGIVSSAELTDSDALLVVHPSGLVLFNSKNPEGEPQYLKVVEPELKNYINANDIYRFEQNGKSYYGKTLTMPDLGWKIVMLSERSSLIIKTDETIHKYVSGAFVSTAGILILLVGAIYLLFYNRSLQKLVMIRTQNLQEIIDTLVTQEKTIRKSEERYSTLVDNIPGVVFRCENHTPWHMHTITVGVEKLTGYTQEQFLKSTSGIEWEGIIHEEDQDRVSKLMEGVNGKDYEMEYRIHHKDGDVKWVYERGSVILPDEGISFIDGIIFDITERKQTEAEVKRLYEEMEAMVEERTNSLKSAMNQLVEQEKMASLGAIVSGVAHEINTPLGIGITTTSYLKRLQSEFLTHLESDKISKSKTVELIEASNESLQILETNLTRAAELINTFKMISVNQITEERSGFNFKEYLENILLALKHRYKNRGIEIYLDCPGNLEIYSYPGAVSQIFTILLLNTFIHGFSDQSKGEVRISARVSEDGQRLNLIYEDNGSGIPEDSVGRIFEPFYMVKRTENGSGLGLYIAYNIMTQKLGGHIRCQSKVGKGTTFIMDLPYIRL